MKAFVIELENRPGELARVTEAIAERGINITAVAGGTAGQKGAIGLMTNDEPGTKSALETAGIAAKAIEVIGINLAHQPGTLAAAARRLANAGVNIELLLPTDLEGSEVSVALGVDNIEKAREALGELAISRV